MPEWGGEPMMRNRTSILLALLGTSVLAAPALAQGAAAPAADAAEEAQGLSDIVVTARRRTEPLQATPLAVSALDSRRLEEARVSNITDLTNLTPSITLARNTTNPTSLFPWIRGFGTKSTDPAAEPPIAITIDGIYQAQLVGAFVNLFDVEAIEVLRGPQGTLLGKNAPAGGLSIRTRRPGEEFAAKGQIEYGSFKNLHASGWVDVPLVPGALFGTVSANYQHSNGYQKNIVTGQTLGGINTSSFRAGLLAKLGDSTTWYVTAQYDQDKGEDAGDRNISTTDPLVVPGLTYVVPPSASLTCTNAYSRALCANGTLPNNRRYTTQALPGPDRDSHNFSVASNLDVDTGPVALALVTGYRQFRELAFSDIDGTQLGIIDSRYDGNYRAFSQEFRVASSDGGGLDMGGRLRWLVGSYYFNYDYDRFNRSTTLGAPSTTYQEGETKSYALFAHAEFDILSNLNLSGGIRQTWDRKTHLSRAQRFFSGIDPEFSQRHAWDNISYDVTLNYNITPNNMIYVRRATGYRGGGFTGVPATALAVSTADPETVGAWEFGSKNDFFNHRLRINLSVFRNKFQDLQRVITVPVDVAPFFVQRLLNVASGITQGAEVELQARPVSGLTLRANLGYLDAKYTQFNANVTGNLANGNADLTFLRFPYTSKWTAQFGATYEADLGSSGKLVFSADYNYRSRYNVTDLNYAFGEQKGFGLLSGTITWRDADDRYSVSVFGRNLTDKFYIDGGDAVGGLTTYVSDGPPREWGVSVGFNF
ncbi:TonB dependent receptor [Rhizorhabdus wittichii DC-6]|nr:TonB dependent receptor [Rhizorhabdus wittichii DC-6]